MSSCSTSHGWTEVSAVSWVADPCLSSPNPLTLFGLKKPTPFRNRSPYKIIYKMNMCHCHNFWAYSVHLSTPKRVLQGNKTGSPLKLPKFSSTGDRKRSAPHAVRQPSRRPAAPVCRGDSACHRPWCSPGGPRTRTRHRLPREVEN